MPRFWINPVFSDTRLLWLSSGMVFLADAGVGDHKEGSAGKGARGGVGHG